MNDIFSDELKVLDKLKADLNALRLLDNHRIHEALELEYTYESNRIEGSTLTLKETDLVINEGITIGGKSMREHLEAINHKEAIILINDLAANKEALTEKVLKQIHYLILRGIDKENAGEYRRVPVMIKGSSYVPPQPYLVAKQMEDFFIFYDEHNNLLHAVVLAAEMHERLVTIHPLIDGNGRTARLIMNLLLIREGFPIANIRGDADSRLAYYNALEKAQVKGDKTEFIHLIIGTVKESLERYLSLLNG